MSDVREDFDGELNADFWRDYIEEKKATRSRLTLRSSKIFGSIK
jgi:hypothetical protein